MQIKISKIEDISPIIKNEKYQDLAIDFLGLNAVWREGAWFLQLRAESLYSCPFFHKAYASALDPMAEINKASICMGALLNGAVIDRCFLATILHMLVRMEAERFNSDLVESYVEEADFSIGSLFAASSFTWTQFCAKCIDRLAVYPEDKAVSDYCAVVIKLCEGLFDDNPVTESVMVLNKVITEKFLEHIKNVKQSDFVQATKDFISGNAEGQRFMGQPLFDWGVLLRELALVLFQRGMQLSDAANVVAIALASTKLVTLSAEQVHARVYNHEAIPVSAN
jgi:hypothetical protein